MNGNQSTTTHELSERERMVLNSIVENFVDSAVPVGSRMLAKKYKMSISPATIRNTMMDLEELGYVTHPHTSAGRQPTDKGYRYYVDSLAAIGQLGEKEKSAILDHIREVSQEVEAILDAASHMLARISSQLGVVLSPRFYQGVFDKMEIVQVAETKLLLVISIQGGLVKTIMMEIDRQVSRETIEDTTRIINERLHGLTLEGIKTSIDKRLRGVDGAESALVKLIVESAGKLFDFDSRRNFHFGGAQNIMSKPEFSNHENLSKILNILENKEMIIHIFGQEDQGERLSITIGHENHDELLAHCTLITSSYHVGNISGTLGVLGPTRMQYPKTIALVDYISKVLTTVLQEHAV
jgi:heat-inducible transcriptional repressor